MPDQHSSIEPKVRVATPEDWQQPADQCRCGHTSHWHGDQPGAPGTGGCEYSPDCGCERFVSEEGQGEGSTLRESADQLAHSLGEAICDGLVDRAEDLWEALEALEALLPNPKPGWWRDDPRFAAAVAEREKRNAVTWAEHRRLLEIARALKGHNSGHAAFLYELANSVSTQQSVPPAPGGELTGDDVERLEEIAARLENDGVREMLAFEFGTDIRDDIVKRISPAPVVGEAPGARVRITREQENACLDAAEILEGLLQHIDAPGLDEDAKRLRLIVEAAEDDRLNSIQPDEIRAAVLAEVREGLLSKIRKERRNAEVIPADRLRVQLMKDLAAFVDAALTQQGDNQGEGERHG